MLNSPKEALRMCIALSVKTNDVTARVVTDRQTHKYCNLLRMDAEG